MILIFATNSFIFHISRTQNKMNQSSFTHETVFTKSWHKKFYNISLQWRKFLNFRSWRYYPNPDQYMLKISPLILILISLLLSFRILFQKFDKNQTSKMNLVYFIQLPCILFIYLTDALQPIHRLFLTPNHKALLTYPISTSPTSTWLFLNFTQPPSWNLSNKAVSVPFTSNGTAGISIDITVSSNGFYTCQIEVNCSISQTPIYLSINGMIEVKWSAGQGRCYYSLMNNLNVGNFSYYLWAQSGLTITYIGVSPTIHRYWTSISLRHHPSQRMLVLVTNISSILMGNITKFLQNTKVRLSLKTSIPKSCSLSEGASTNPADFADYSSQTNFEAEANNYKYSLIPEGDPLRQNIQNGIVVIGISNILVDCTVDVSVQLADGHVFADLYWMVFEQSIDPNIQYIETSISLMASGRYYSYIIPNKLVTVTVENLIFNPKWDLAEFKTKAVIRINNINCPVYYSMCEDNFLKMFCQNNTPANDMSTYFTSLPDLYLRDQTTLSLINVTVAQKLKNPNAYVVDRTMTADAYYYKGNSVFHILYSVQIEDSWRSSLSNINIGVNINGFTIPTSWIKIVSDPNNYVAAEFTWIGFTNTDSIDIQFISHWMLNTVEGYHNQWSRTAPSNVYFLPGNSPSQNSSTNSNTTNQNTGGNQGTNNGSGMTDTYSLKVYLVEDLVKLIKYYMKSWCAFLFSYFIASLVNLEGMSFLYYFLDFHSALNSNRRQISDSIKIMGGQTSYYNITTKWMGIQYQTNFLPPDSNPLLSLSSKTNVLSFSEYGYSFDFLDNQFQDLVQILITICKLCFIKFMLKLPSKLIKKVCKRILLLWDEIILFEIIMLAPKLNVVTGVFYRQSCLFKLTNFKEMFNLALIHFFAFFCVFLILTIFIFRVKRRRALIHRSFVKKTKRKSKFSTEVKIQKKFNKNFSLIYEIFPMTDNLMYVLVPLLVGYGNVSIFMVVMTVATTLKLQKLIFYRQLFKRPQFWKIFINKIVWFVFNLVYVMYWLIDLLQIDCSHMFWHRALITADYAESVLFIAGCFVQIGISIVDLLLQTYKVLKSHKKQKQQHAPKPDVAKKNDGNSEDKTRWKVMVKFTNNFCSRDNSSNGDVRQRKQLSKIKVVQSRSFFKSSPLNN